MSVCHISLRLILPACLCVAATGCVTQETTRMDGSFKTGGSGQYGEPAPGSVTRTLAKQSQSKKNPDYVAPPDLKLSQAKFEEEHGFRDEARKSYELVLTRNSKSIEAIIGLARLDQVAGRTVEAEAGFQKAIKMNPRSGLALDALGQFYVEQKRWNEAVATLQKATVVAPEEKTFQFHYGIALGKAGRLDEAVPLLVSSVGSAATHYNVGIILHDQGDLAASEEEFAAAVLESPRMQQAQHWLGEVRRERELQLAGANVSAVQWAQRQNQR
jgi:tetratricopeptide (TPR) repeat protein